MERLTIEGLKRIGAVVGGGFLLLTSTQLWSTEGAILTGGALAGVAVIVIYYAGNKDHRPTWKPITGGAWGGTVAAALLIYEDQALRLSGFGIGIGLALSLVNYGVRGLLAQEENEPLDSAEKGT